MRVGVIGVGQLGSRHARLYSESEEAELVAVADIDAGRARRVAEAHGGRAVTDYRDLPNDIEAVSVATPTTSHKEITCALLDAGVHVLVEKPMATSREEAREMIALAEAKKLRLVVGHTERYNPAVGALLAQATDPRFIEVHRLGSFSPRSLDIDVVLDLMIHDLDVIAELVPARIAAVEAVGVPVLTPRVDIANARLRFDNGAVANLTASRVSQDKTRKLRVFEPDRYVSVDYQTQEAIRFRVVRDGTERPEILRDVLEVENEEPLRRELRDFLHAASTGREPLVPGSDGLRALDLAFRVIESMESAQHSAM